METNQFQVFMGGISSTIFIVSNIPMILKAMKTRDLRSYSMGYLILSNVGNLIHWIYVVSLPFGPIWFLHGFYTLVAALMLLCYLRFELTGRSVIQQINRRELKMKLCKCGCASPKLTATV